MLSLFSPRFFFVRLAISCLPQSLLRPRRLPCSSPPPLHGTQTQRDSSCNHGWTQFQGQFENYLLSVVNKKTEDKHILDAHLRPFGRFMMLERRGGKAICVIFT